MLWRRLAGRSALGQGKREFGSNLSNLSMPVVFASTSSLLVPHVDASLSGYTEVRPDLYHACAKRSIRSRIRYRWLLHVFGLKFAQLAPAPVLLGLWRDQYSRILVPRTEAVHSILLSFVRSVRHQLCNTSGNLEIRIGDPQIRTVHIIFRHISHAILTR